MKATAAIVDIPVSVAADAAILGGFLSEKDGESTYTEDALSRLRQNVEGTTAPEDTEEPDQ